ncbi:LysR family transcriptional regulator [Acetobacteraceae bacterium H6797]|nr:LysR family transcriptional regulator [Acetobacteraceae bacterium H6797]
MARKKEEAPPARSGIALRVDLRSGLRLEPGGIALLEAIAEWGSIAAAGRRLAISYKHAWEMVEALSQGLGKPVIMASPGGRHGGGSVLTREGESLVRHYRGMEQAATLATAGALKALDRLAARR